MKFIPLLAFLVLCSGLVFAAGEMRTIDFSNSSSLLVQIGLNDGVRFDWADKNHQIVVTNLNMANQRVELSIFIEGAPTPSYSSVTPKTSVVLDFDRDDVKDLKVSFVKFVSSDTVILLLEKISEPKFGVQEELQGGSWFNRIFSIGPFQNAFYNLGLLVLIVILLVIFLFSSRFIRRKYRRIRRSFMMG